MAELRERFGDAVNVRLVEGARGVFDVVVQGQRIFSKHALHRFPDPGEIVTLVASSGAA
ncbi:MAG: Rdx family protein [Nannocystaceae bacterium]|nr:Rdx family protein [Nannocystaceae bacterium]